LVGEDKRAPQAQVRTIDWRTGIQYFQRVTKIWTPFFNGATTFYETINIQVEKVTL
jgi:hypothetical protein